MKAQKRRILKRDEHKCGIHLAGCGQILKAEEATIGHIVPQALHYEWENSHVPTAVKDSNVQPMCLACNEKMKATFPILPIESACRCCQWVFAKETKRVANGAAYLTHKDPRLAWRPVLPMDNAPDTPRGKVALIRLIRLSVISDRDVCITMPSTETRRLTGVSRNSSSEELIGPVCCVWLGANGRAGLQSRPWLGGTGAIVSIPEMLRHNYQNKHTVLTLWQGSRHVLNGEENTSIEMWLNDTRPPPFEVQTILGIGDQPYDKESIKDFEDAYPTSGRTRTGGRS